MERIRRSYLYEDRYQVFLKYRDLQNNNYYLRAERECSYDTKNKDEIDSNNGDFVAPKNTKEFRNAHLRE